MDTASGTVLDFFSTVEDPRQSAKVLYPLDEILLIALGGCLAGADNFVQMTDWARLNLEMLRQIRPFAKGVPSHDAVNDVINVLDPGTFEECFLDWIEAIRPDAPDLIAIDAKTSRRTGHAGSGRKPLHTLSAYARGQRLVLAQEIVDRKTNEGTMIPSLLDKLRLKGSTVTIDAAGCQRPIAETIVEAGGDYVYILSREMTAAEVLEAVRGHWSVENSVHWVLDVIFGDDDIRLRSAYGPRNMALIQRIALNLLRHKASGKDSLTVKRKKAGWSMTYLIETVTGIAA